MSLDPKVRSVVIDQEAIDRAALLMRERLTAIAESKLASAKVG
jgi:hypothetical protein